MKWILASPLLLVWILFSNCGKVGDPIPPFIQIPAPVIDLATKQLGKDVILSWSIPKLNVDGSEATKLESFEILRVIRASGLTPFTPELFSQEAVLLITIPKSSFKTYLNGEKMVLNDRLPDQGDEVFQKEVSYAIQASNHKGREAGLSNISSLQLVPVPEPPSNLACSYSEGFIELTWVQPSQRIDLSPLKGEVQFNVYRSETASQPVFEALTKTPTTDTSFKDATAVLDKTYLYMVRSVISQGETFVESSDSQTLQALNADIYPPKTPTGLSGFSNGEFVSLVWIPNSETDLAGYDVYRSSDGKDYKKLTEQLEAASSFIDHKVEKGNLYYYRVKAVDTHKNSSEFSDEISVRVE